MGAIVTLAASLSLSCASVDAAPLGVKGKPKPSPTTTTTVASSGSSNTTTTTTAPTTTTRTVATTTTSAPSNTQRSLYWGAWIGSQYTGGQAPWDMNAVAGLASLVGKQPSVVNWSSPFYMAGGCSGYCNFSSGTFNLVRNYGAIPFFSWANSPGTGAFTDAQVAAGSQDAYIDNWAKAAAGWGHPLFLRFAWEMNGSWMPWGVGANGNTAADYVAMWRHVHDRFKAAGATNVSWVWCPNVDGGNKLTPLTSVYPGDAYVDWTCLDGYNWGTNPAGHMSGWQSFDSIFRSTYQTISGTVAPTKPMIIGETASTEYGGSKAAWITDLLAVQLKQYYPAVRGVLWFDMGGSEGDGMDWPIGSSATAAAAFKAGIADSAYQSNHYGSLQTSPIPAP